MRPVKRNEYNKIWRYYKRDIPNCVYPYINITNLKNGEDKNITFWYDENENGIETVLMKYYDSIHIYSLNDLCDLTDAAKIICKHNVSMVSGKSALIKRLNDILENYEAEYGFIFEMDSCRAVKNSNGIQRATVDDVPEIAALICSDKSIGGHYTPEVLEKQMISRMQTQTGRSYIIRREGAIIAHTATYAEADGIAVVSGTIVTPGCGHEHYFLISNFIIGELLNEGRQIFTFAVSDKMVRYHRATHKECAEYGKMVLRGGKTQ